jgi:hypothetical protein
MVLLDARVAALGERATEAPRRVKNIPRMEIRAHRAPDLVRRKIMTESTRQILRALALLLWLLFAWQGISGGIAQLSSTETALQRAQTYSQLAFGILSLLVVATAFRARAVSRYARIPWAVAVVLAAGLAPVAWGGTGWGSGAAAAALGVVIAAVLLWALRFATRQADADGRHDATPGR